MRSCFDSTPSCCIPFCFPKNQNVDGTGCRESKINTTTKYCRKNKQYLEKVQMSHYINSMPTKSNFLNEDSQCNSFCSDSQLSIDPNPDLNLSENTSGQKNRKIKEKVDEFEPLL